MDEVEDILDQDPNVVEEEEEEEEDEMEIDENDEVEDEEENGEEEENEEEEEDEEQNAPNNETSKATMPQDKAPMDKLHHYYLSMLQSAKIASTYNISPTAAIPIQTHVNAMTMSKGLKYLFLGGSDGYIRKYDFLNTLQGKLSLTIIQKHSLTESVTNAGILTGYWPNEVPQYKKDISMVGKTDYQPVVSPVYSLAVEDECMYMLSGLQDGGIVMQGVRYMEGAIVHYFKEHTQVVNILKLNGVQDKFMSGSWDKRILEWDLHAGGRVCSEFQGNNSEISSMEYRPLFSSVDVMSKSGGEQQEEEDDIESLFGDDEEEEEEAQQQKRHNAADEISSTSLNVVYDENTLMTSGLNGIVHIWDKRDTSRAALTLQRGPATPPWCMSAAWDRHTGDKIYVGRRNACVEEYDLKMATSQPASSLKLPSISGPVSCVQSLPNGKHLLVASRDNIRLFDTSVPHTGSSSSSFLIVPGHHGGVVSHLHVDPTCRYLISASGSRGWQGHPTDTVLVYDIDLQ